MTIQTQTGGAGSWKPAMAAARAGKGPKITAVQDQGKAQASQHIVPAKEQAVDDGAHGTHDYDTTIHPQVLGQLDAHGARLDQHDARIKRLEAGGADLGSPGHHKGG